MKQGKPKVKKNLTITLKTVSNLTQKTTYLLTALTKLNLNPDTYPYPLPNQT